MPLFGAHMSIAGGLTNAIKHIQKIDGAALQIFTKNQRQWFVKPLTEDEIEDFHAAWREWGENPIASHDSYLINLANPGKEAATRSVNAFADEIKRCAQLGIPYLIMHPGSHVGEGVSAGLATLTANLDIAIEKAASTTVTILLETTAGQGSGLGVTFQELAHILEHSRHEKQFGICYDTCHTFAAGYDIRTPESYQKTFDEFDKIIGIERLKFFHLNDAKKGLGSRVDRHQHIGKGEIGLAGFSHLINDPRFSNHPMVLETPKEKDLADDIVNLSTLRSLIKKKD
jgi:deoxyribonuclease-4